MAGLYAIKADGMTVMRMESNRLQNSDINSLDGVTKNLSTRIMKF